MKPTELRAEELTCTCSDSDIPPAREQQPEEPPPQLPGQTRGLDAIAFGLSLKKRWFNITVAGAPGSGKTTAVVEVVRKKAAAEPPGLDICIHNNFENPNRPGVIYLAPGGGAALNRLIDELLKLLDKQIPHLLEQSSTKAYIQELQGGFEAKEKALSRTVEEFAEGKGIVLQTTQQGVNMIPLSDGKPMREEEFLSMDVEQREGIEVRRKEVLERLAEINPQIMALEKEKREVTEKFVKDRVTDMVQAYHEDMRQLIENPTRDLLEFLDTLEKEMVEKHFLFFSETTAGQPFGGQQLQVMRQQFANSCRLNVVVSRAGQQGAPVVVENNPTYSNLIGGVDFVEEHGVLKADFTRIRAGSLLQASGGYLVLQASDLVQNSVAYYALKRALRSGEVKMRDQLAEMGFRSGAHLEPDAIPVETKVILLGEEWLIQMIQSADHEFARLFKIHADFSHNLERTSEVMEQFVGYLHHQVKEHGLLPLENGAMARVVEEASRTVSHQNRLTAQVKDLMDVLIEADLLAREQGGSALTRSIVDEALANKKYRHSKIEEMVKREISEGTILLDFNGSKVGQVNGLAVYQVSQVSFGVPTRITAQAYAGRSGLINIEREADLSGRIHTKGVLILNGYLGRLFARKKPLALSISICFEQNYGGIEGDSATAAEFFVILSAITQLPLKQFIAVTGSMNQHGEIQPIGGVNEKVAGFYQFAREHGFPEGCGVMIPAVNKVNLMLDQEIIDDVRAGKFHLYPVGRIEEGLSLMTGKPAGELQPEGNFPPESVYAIAAERLREFSKEAGKKEEDKEEPE